MKKLLIVLVAFLVLSSCSKSSKDLTTLTITAGIKYGTPSADYPFSGEPILYLFNNISVHNGYTYVGNGYMQQDGTNVKVLYSQKAILSSGFHIFNDLERITYTVILDGTVIFNDHIGDKTPSITVNLNNDLAKNGYEYKFIFSIWPWDPWDIYK